jgi:hypothetical protein
VSVPEALVPAIRRLVHQLVVGDFAGLEASTVGGGMAGAEMRVAVEEYGRTLIDPPDVAIRSANVYPLGGSSWAVDVDLWTAEEEKSDLTMSLTLEAEGGSVRARIDDIHVL